MPQATTELQNEIERRFGSIDLDGPLGFLRREGWREIRNGILQPTKPPHEISREEWDCVNFLIQEWDFDYHEHQG